MIKSFYKDDDGIVTELHGNLPQQAIQFLGIVRALKSSNKEFFVPFFKNKEILKIIEDKKYDYTEEETEAVLQAVTEYCIAYELHKLGMKSGSDIDNLDDETLEKIGDFIQEKMTENEEDC